jgi:predicted peptidase
MKKLTFLFLVMYSINSVFAQSSDMYKKEIFIHKGDTLPLRILYPDNFSKEKKYPVVIVLHGSGERGNDNEKQLVHGSKLFLDPVNRQKFPAVVIFPQCSQQSSWSNVSIKPNGEGNRTFNFKTGGKPAAGMALLTAYIDQLKDLKYLDKNRFYVGGLSMGGFGTFEVLRREKNLFAAAFPICGGDNPENAKKYKNIPLWIFHGEKDDVVPAELSQNVYNELIKIGAKPKLSIYPNVNHFSWENAFREPDLLPWLFSQHK